MNNNRGNNRRRGRSNRSQGGNQLNRIDSRARGNAPQLLDKYRKLAQDASLNGDRVQAEYYLQFADHYFRVIADSRPPRDETRNRREDRDGESPEEDGEEERGNRGSEQRQNSPEDQSDRDEASEFEPSENPFTRDNRQQRGRAREELKPRRPRAEEEGAAELASSIDTAALPPSIMQPAAETETEAAEEAPKPRRRTRRSKTDGDESLENVG